MELGLQFGYGMMDHCRSLLRQWGGGTVILSPRDLNDDQLCRLANEVNEIGGAHVMLDPQFYLPHADHERLKSHAYWPQNYQTGTFWAGSGVRDLVANVSELNQQLGTSDFILPGLFAESVDQTWLATQREVINAARGARDQRRVIATVALSGQALRDPEQVADVVESSEDWEIDGVYLICEHPSSGYFVDEPLWLANVLDLIAAFRLRGKTVVLGYCNQQLLIAACAKVNVVASGTWMNVRTFPQEKFRMSYDDEIRQRATWYYCPHALSEYKVPFLDVAYRQRTLDLLRPRTDVSEPSVGRLFGAVLPSSVGLTEQSAFRHYLSQLRAQTLVAEGASFDETIERHEALLKEAESVLELLRRAGVLGQARDFGDAIDVNRAALEVFKNTQGPMLRRRWDQL
jgi:hypothetical protein